MDKLSIFYSIKYIGKNNVIATYGDNDKVVFVHLAEHWKYGVMVVDVYISSTSGNTKVKSRQQYIINILSAAKIPFEVKDISSSETDKQFMFKALEENGKTVIAPQLFLGSEYLGDYDEFIQANENEMLLEFLKLNDSSRASSLETES